jgi:hypothetical protein
MPVWWLWLNFHNMQQAWKKWWKLWRFCETKLGKSDTYQTLNYVVPLDQFMPAHNEFHGHTTPDEQQILDGMKLELERRSNRRRHR